MISLQSQRNLVKRQVRKQVDRAVASQLSLFSETFGKSVKIDLFTKDGAGLRKTAERWVDNSFDAFGTDWNILSRQKRREKLAEFLDNTFRTFTRVPRGKHALPWYRNQMKDALTVRGSSRFAVSYNRYSDATGWLVRGLFKAGRNSAAQEFFLNFAKSEERFSLAQLFAQQVLPSYASLDRLEAKALGPRDIHKLAKLYLLYSGAFEKLARMLVALNRIRRLEVVDYDGLTKKSMAELQKDIKKEPRLRILLSAFDRHLRNSVAHPSYSIHFSAKRVIFRDRAKVVDMTWNRFREETLGLSVLVFAISVSGFLHFFLNVLVALQRVIGHNWSDTTRN